jgi:prevent-host-death family protein
MRIASVAEVKSQFSAFLKATAGGPVVVTKNGRPVAVIVGVQDDDEVERLLMAYSPRLQAIVEASRKQVRDGDVLTHDEFWAEVEAARSPKRRAKKGPRVEPPAAPDRPRD